MEAVKVIEYENRSAVDRAVHAWCTLGANSLMAKGGQSRNSAAALTDKNRFCRCLGTMRPTNSLRNKTANLLGGVSLPLR